MKALLKDPLTGIAVAAIIGVAAVLWWRKSMASGVASGVGTAIKKPQPIATDVKGTVNDPRYQQQIIDMGLF